MQSVSLLLNCTRITAVLIAFAFTTAAAAQAFSATGGPVRIVVAYPPGGVSDAIARSLAKRVTTSLGVPVVVENRGGAGGVVAMESLRHAAPDGRTLVFSAVSPLTIAPLLGSTDLDPERDVTPVMSVMVTPVLVVATHALASDTLAAVIVAARANVGGIRWATSGVGTTGHRVLERVQGSSGVDFTHVPYKGGSQQLVDALAGEFEVLSTNVGELQLRYVREGRLKALAVGAPKRLDVLPEVPTLAEAGFPEANLASTFGLFAPGRTPAQTVEELNRAFNAALRDPDIQQRLRAVGNLPAGGSPADFAGQIRRERE